MKSRLAYLLISIVISALLLSACAGRNQPGPDQTPEPAETAEPGQSGSLQKRRILPRTFS